MQAPNFDRWLYIKLHSLHLMGTAERKLLSRHVTPGMTVLDVGANIGLYSVFLADLVGNEGRVFAFEPDPALFETALTNIRQNGKENVVKIYNLALGSRTGLATLYRTPFNSGDNRLSSSPAHNESVPVKVARLDDVLCGEKIDFVKVDVQGWEAEVMRGMEQVLRDNPRLTIFFEYWPKGLSNAGESLSAPSDILDKYGFAIFLADRGEPLSIREIENLSRAYTGNRFINLIAQKPTLGR